MKKTILIFAASLLLATPLQAGCYADYKAKQDDPLKLHYGVAEISGPCDPAAATTELKPRLAREGWVLLNVLSVFDEVSLAGKEESAGSYFLRF